jgi:hypothetical protein
VPSTHCPTDFGTFSVGLVRLMRQAEYIPPLPANVRINFLEIDVLISLYLSGSVLMHRGNFILKLSSFAGVACM